MSYKRPKTNTIKVQFGCGGNSQLYIKTTVSDTKHSNHAAIDQSDVF